MKKLTALLILLSCTLMAFSQVYNPVQWNTAHKQIGDQVFDLIYTATIEDGWNVYSQYLENDDGPVATTFTYDKGSHFELVGKNKESKQNRKEAYDKLFDMNVIKFTKKATFTQSVKVKDLTKPITGYLNFMVCNDTRCIPPTDVDFKFKLKSVGTNKDKTQAAPKTKQQKQAPKTATSNKSNKKGTLAIEALDSPETTASAKTETKKQVQPTISNDKTDILEPVKWFLDVKKAANDTYELVFTARMDKKWTIYSQFTDDNGPVPTSFNFDKADHFTLVGKAKEKGKKKEGPDPLFDNVNVIKFVKSPTTFTQKIKVKDPSKPLTGYLTFMTCDNARCLPPTDIDFYINPNKQQALLGDAAIKAIDALGGGSSNVAATPTNTPPALSTASRNIEGNVIDQLRPILKQTYDTPLGNCGAEDTAAGQSLFWTFIFGFAGGLIALLTPCVFPMIPLTVSFFTKGSKDRATGIKNGLIYGLSIIVIYVAIGLIITGVFGPTALNALSTNWIANVLFFLIFVFFAFSFFGYYEITLPSSWANKSDSMADQGGLIGTFFMAFTLALVSFSCTGPIIGSALVSSATDTMGPLVVMLGFSSALALPFGLFAAFPAWLNSLPRSGGWMNSVKVVLGFLELALALKFLSVADMTMHWGILKYELFMGLWVIIFALMTAYLFGFIKFPHDSPVTRLSGARWFFSFFSLGLTLYLCSGFMINKDTGVYNSLALMSGLAPPAHYNYFLKAQESQKDIKSRYPSFTKCANNLDCFKDYYEGLAYAQEKKMPVLLDFTGFGCVNCRKTEEHIWVEDIVKNKLENDFVLISLYVDDRKALDDMLISKSRDVKLRTIGSLWADFQIVNFAQNSQPLYVMMAPDEQVIAKPRGYKEGVEDYAQYLECGLEIFSKKNK